ncbi:DUF3616 domain-containing protein [Rhizobium leguminosarum]|uniref:DUF3616 domain-containing protein n=1 Tax=Rhizobium leguminosarum TaxID=384 RepID=UPI001C94062E|nr:DUF3616 domain-containing protein [Rhizobium leguminosarum]MBY5523571.1 DUF3616 domain-containing protein [Rhizobium leguminosarum]
MSEQNVVRLRLDGTVSLHFEAAGTPKLLKNLSGCTVWKGFLWTVSDEGRTIECLAPFSSGYNNLVRSVSLDALFDDLSSKDHSDEIDLEDIAASDGYLWVCDSHSRVRRSADGRPTVQIKNGKSRRLLGRLKLDRNGGTFARAERLPSDGDGGLRSILEANEFLAPFAGLPSKEGGIDLEGITVGDQRVFVGLRGLVIDGKAIVAELFFTEQFRVRSTILHFIDLQGLGIRDLEWSRGGLLLIAGPVGSARVPFHIFRWSVKSAVAPERVFSFEPSIEKPEAPLCRGGRRRADDNGPL